MSLPYTKDEETQLVQRYAQLYRKDKNYYAFNYGEEHTVDDRGKKKYKKQPWFVGYPIKYETYCNHLKKDQVSIPNRSWGLILPPTTEENEASFGAIDKDVYDDQKDLKRIVKQIYDEKLPLVPCYSKSKGLHIYFYCKDDVSAEKIRSKLQYYNKHLGINAKEVNPKQTKLKWNKKKKRFDPGNGILVPYMDCLERNNKQELFLCECLNPWIKNADLETGTLEEFLDYAEDVSVSKDFFGEQHKELEEKPKEEKPQEEKPQEEKPKEEKPQEETEERDFSESNARPLSQSLQRILNNIKNKREHNEGGTFDNWIVSFVAIAVSEMRSDKEIMEHLESVWEYADKIDDEYQGRNQKDYFEFKISNCRDKFDKADPGPLREKFMQDTIYNLKGKKYYNKNTQNSYEKDPYDIKFAHFFSKRIPPTTYFKEHHNKQLAEEETYRPDLHKENDPLMKGADGLYYLNNYRPGKIKPIKPEKQKDLEPFLELMEHLATIEKERNHVLDIVAYILQNPWKKVKTITVFYTKHQRFGKGTFFDTLTDILGETNAEPTDVKGVLDKGVMFAEKQLILVDECKSVGDFGERANFINDLKKIGTETRIQQRKLYIDYKIIKTQTNYLIFTNNPDALNIEAEDERLFVIANENLRKPQEWYKAYHKWRQDKGSSYVFWYLLNRDISKFDPMAPPPMTEGKKAMRDETGHPLTRKLGEWIEEGTHPFALNECVRGTTELAEYISKHGRGDYVRYANNPKQLKRSLEACGCVFIGQVLHTIRNEKPTLFLYKNAKQLLEKFKPSQLCNNIWKPLTTYQSAADVRDDKADRHFQDNQNENADLYEEALKKGKKSKSRSTKCWACHRPLSTSQDGTCPECEVAIKCSCGKCYCDKPGSKIKKKH